MATPILLGNTHEAHAKCGPSLDIQLSADDRMQNRWTTVGSETRLLDRGSYDAEQVVNDYDYVDDETENQRVSLTLRIPLGEDYCEEQQLAKKRADEARAHQAHLNNIEKQIKLCDKYGEQHPLLRGQCK